MIDTENRSTRNFICFVFIIYLVILIKLIIFKWSFSYTKNHFLHNYNWSYARYKLDNLYLVPFRNISSYLFTKETNVDPVSNLYGNILGFVPIGIFIPLLFRNARTAGATILRVFFVSLAFELTQLLILLGYFDVDDLLLNTAGGAIGYWLFYLQWKKKIVR